MPKIVISGDTAAQAETFACTGPGFPRSQVEARVEDFRLQLPGHPDVTASKALLSCTGDIYYYILSECPQRQSRQTLRIPQEIRRILSSKTGPPVLVEIPVDNPDFAIALLCSGAYWVFPKAANKTNLIEMVSKARNSSKRWVSIGALPPEDGPTARVFVSMCLTAGHEDESGFSALKAIEKHLPNVRFFNCNDSIPSDLSSDRSLADKVFSQIRSCNYYIAFLSPDGSRFHREGRLSLLDQSRCLEIETTSYLRDSTVHRSAPESFSSIMRKFREFLPRTTEYLTQAVHTSSPSVLMEVGYAWERENLKGRILFLQAAMGIAKSYKQTAMLCGAQVRTYHTESELAQQLFLSFKEAIQASDCSGRKATEFC
jgi:hypothetical protein